jgi:hypothetical protein
VTDEFVANDRFTPEGAGAATLGAPLLARSPAGAAPHRSPAAGTPPPTYHRTGEVEGIEIFFREAGDPAAPTLVLLHGFPSSSHMFRVVGDHNLGERVMTTKDDVAPLLPNLNESGLRERLDALPARDPRQLGHTSSRCASKRSSGTGNPSSSSASM